jgi:hypothetical protein
VLWNGRIFLLKNSFFIILERNIFSWAAVGGGSSVVNVAAGKGGHIAAVLRSGVKTHRTEFQWHRWETSKNLTSFPLVKAYHVGSLTHPVKDPLERKYEDTNLLRYVSSYVQVQIPECWNIQTLNYQRISLFLFNECCHDRCFSSFRATLV